MSSGTLGAYTNSFISVGKFLTYRRNKCKQYFCLNKTHRKPIAVGFGDNACDLTAHIIRYFHEERLIDWSKLVKAIPFYIYKVLLLHEKVSS